jgi:uncharacterized membrane protein YheB (UPF0754 family)
MYWTLFLIPVISASIGWVTNWIGFKFLFHPKKQKKVLGITLQGILPKRQQQFAIQLGKLVSSELLSFAELEQKIADPQNVTKILPLLEIHIDTFLREKLTAEIPMLGMLIGEKTIAQVKGVFMKELEELFPVLMKQYLGVLQTELNIEKIVIEKLSNFSTEKVEELLIETMSTELRFAGIVGAIIGLVIGLFQVFLIMAMR